MVVGGVVVGAVVVDGVAVVDGVNGVGESNPGAGAGTNIPGRTATLARLC